MNLSSIVNESNNPAGKVFDLFIQFLIILSLVTFTIETLPGNSERTIQLLNHIELFCVVVFSVEYILRLIVAEKKLRFVFSFYGVIDVLAILPFYLSLGIDLRSIRAFRLFRLFRIFKVVRYSGAMKRFHKAFLIAKEEIVLFSLVTVVLLYLSAVGIYYCENEAQPEKFSSILDSMWWAVATLTTVGYGDIYPITAGGKIFTFFILMIGLGIVSVPAGLIASAFNKARGEEL